MENKKRVISLSNPMERNKKVPREEKQKQHWSTVDLVADIISRLPAEDLVRFTCVSKSWRSLICTDSDFHRLQSQRNTTKNTFMLTGRRTKTGPNQWSYRNYWSDIRRGILREVSNPFEEKSTQVLGLCHCLLLLRQQHGLKMAVSNPSTGGHVMVPPNPAGDANVVFCGFGYDPVHGCYKVVTKVEHRLELMVYDLNKGTWGSTCVQFDTWWRCQRVEPRAWETLNYFWNRYPVLCADGAVFWSVETNGDYAAREMVTMVCFLLAEEEFHVVKPPDLGHVRYNPNMTVFHERLCLVCQGLDRRYDVWIVNIVHGMRQWRWAKLFTIPDPSAMLSRVVTKLLPVMFSSEGRDKVRIYVGMGKYLLYDLINKQFGNSNNPPENFRVSCCRSRTADLGFLFKTRFLR